MKLKSFCKAKEATKKTKRQPSEWEKILANESMAKRLISNHNLNQFLNKHLNILVIPYVRLTCDTQPLANNKLFLPYI